MLFFEVVCLNCCVCMSLDVILVDDSMCDIVMVFVDIYLVGEMLVKLLLCYFGLFGLCKLQMVWGCMVVLMCELVFEMCVVQVSWNGIMYVVLIDIWVVVLVYVVDQVYVGKFDLFLKLYGWF